MTFAPFPYHMSGFDSIVRAGGERGMTFAPFPYHTSGFDSIVRAGGERSMTFAPFLNVQIQNHHKLPTGATASASRVIYTSAVRRISS